jgi:hypothetical protein
VTGKVMTRFHAESVKGLKDNIVFLLGVSCHQLYSFEFERSDDFLCKTAQLDLLSGRRLDHDSKDK